MLSNVILVRPTIEWTDEQRSFKPIAVELMDSERPIWRQELIFIVQDMCAVRDNIYGQPQHAVVMGFWKSLSYGTPKDFRANFNLILQFTFIFHCEVTQPGSATVEHNALNYRGKKQKHNLSIPLMGTCQSTLWLQYIIS